MGRQCEEAAQQVGTGLSLGQKMLKLSHRKEWTGGWGEAKGTDGCPQGPVGAPTLFPRPPRAEAPLFSTKLCCLPPRNEDGDFFRASFPPNLRRYQSCCFHGNLPRQPGEGGAGQPSRPQPPSPPHRPCSSLQGGPKVKIIPLPQIFSAGGLHFFNEGRQLFLSLGSGCDMGSLRPRQKRDEVTWGGMHGGWKGGCVEAKTSSIFCDHPQK